MAQTFHVHGPLYALVGVGSAGALLPLGMSRDGADVEIEVYKVPVMTDAAGEAPADYQHTGSTARISFELPAWDEDVLATVLTRAEASGTEGQSGPMGALIGTGGFSHSLYLPSATDRPWFFPTTTLVQPHRVRSGTVHSIKRLTFHAWRYVAPGAASAQGLPLFTRVAPS
jgi:hypothetical protein